MKTVCTTNAPKAIGPYSQAKIVKGVVYTSGQIPLDPVSGEVVKGGILEQTQQVMKNLDAVLKEAGSDFEQVFKTTCFLDDMKYFGEFNEVYANYFTTNPSRSCVAVKDLPKGVLVEVEVIALVTKE